MDYIKSFREEELCEFILGTKESLFICLPLLHPEVVNSIAKLHGDSKGKISINIGLDFSAETFRQGYGEIESFDNKLTISFNVRQMKDNRISFIISDTVGYFLFFESRYLIPADKVTLNAVKIDPISIIKLKQKFFNAFEIHELSDQLSNAIIDESQQMKQIETDLKNSESIISSKIDQNTLDSVKEDLKKNPPLKPDYKRIVEFYSNKFQYVKLEFKGANLMHRKVELPSKALPVMDAELKEKLETKLNLFDKENEEECFKSLNDYKTAIAKLRETYLTKIKSRDESLLSKSYKNEFDAKVCELEKELEKVKSETINNIAGQISKTRERLLKDMIEFFIANPKVLFPLYPNLWQNNDEYIKDAAPTFANEIIFKKINWPKAHLMVEEFKISRQYSDITIEDLKCKEFVTELLEVGLINKKDINQLAKFGKGVEVREIG